MAHEIMAFSLLLIYFKVNCFLKHFIQHSIQSDSVIDLLQQMSDEITVN